MFIDEVNLKLVAGKGGDGCTSFLREKYVPLGGQMVAMEDMVVTLYLGQIRVLGLLLI